jgi:hypothetical protein
MLEVDASSVLGAPQIAGTWVSKKGSATGMVASVAGNQAAGVVGRLAADAVSGRNQPGPAETPELPAAGAFLALSADQLALVKTKRGLLKPKIENDTWATAARSDIASAELGGGTLSVPLTISFTNGVSWTFEVAKAGKKAAEELVAALGGGAA